MGPQAKARAATLKIVALDDIEGLECTYGLTIFVNLTFDIVGELLLYHILNLNVPSLRTH